MLWGGSLLTGCSDGGLLLLICLIQYEPKTADRIKKHTNSNHSSPWTRALNTLSIHVSHPAPYRTKNYTSSLLLIFLSLAFFPLYSHDGGALCLKVSYIKAIDYPEPKGHQSHRCKYLIRKPSSLWVSCLFLRFLLVLLVVKRCSWIRCLFCLPIDICNYLVLLFIMQVHLSGRWFHLLGCNNFGQMLQPIN